MAKTRTRYLCSSCGSDFPRWIGRCPDCGTWDSLEPFRELPEPEPDAVLAGPDAASPGSGMEATPLGAITEQGPAVVRLSTGIGELDRVLGGDEASGRGLVPASCVLIGGEPGIGKSTLLVQAAGGLADSATRVLYATSEESARQVRDRCVRLGVGESLAASESLLLLAETNLARIAEQLRKTKPGVVIIDSVQMVHRPDLDAAPGSIAQLRRCATDLAQLARLSGAAVVLVGHVTKEGSLAGPRVLEHMVDAVLTFEGDRHHAHRIVRAVKNRFGTTQELGVFEMTGAGLAERPEGASVAAGAHTEPKPGSVVCPVLSGSRCLLAEVQALTATGFLGAAKRKSSGLDASRLAMLIAVLEQHAELRLADRDIFAQSVGGVRVAEPASDLALLLAVAGAHHKRALAAGTCVVGEVGLGGEIRGVSRLAMRLNEARRLGYTRAIVPSEGAGAEENEAPGIEIDAVGGVNEAIERLG
ncbi:MAG: DNA repair protein RadA [Planctomycetota bacterium]